MYNSYSCFISSFFSSSDSELFISVSSLLLYPDKISIDYIRDIEEKKNHEFDIFDLDFMNEKQEKNKDDEDIDKYNRYLGMKKGLLEKNKDKFKSLINRLKQKKKIPI